MQDNNAQVQSAAKGAGEKLQSFYENNKKLCLAAAAIVGGIATLKTASICYNIVRRARINAYFRTLEEDIVHVFMHHRWSHGPNFFPQCVKIETFLRVARIPYVVHFTDDASLSPNGRLPFVLHNHTVLADGEFILQYLTETFNVSIDNHLNSTEHAQGLMMKRMVETSINYGFNRTIFVDFSKILVNMFSVEFNLQPVVATVLVRNMRTNTINVLNAVGYGDLSQEQYELEFLRDLQSLETFLKKNSTAGANAENGTFLFGEAPTSYDCSLYAWLQVAGEMGPHGPGLSFLTSSKVLRGFINKMNKVAFPDLDSLQCQYETQRFIPA